MATHVCSWSVRALALMLVAGVTVAVVAGNPMPARAAEKSLLPSEKVEIRKDEEIRVAKEDISSAEQAKALAKQYRETANRVAKQGGDPTSLLQAAAYFDSKANTLSPVRP